MSSLISRLSSWSRHLAGWIDIEGPTRPCALMRIGLAINVWACWSRPLLLFRNLTPERAAISLGFFLCSTLFLLGWHTRLAGLGLAIVSTAIYYYLGSTLHIDTFHHHHTYLLVMGVWLVALTPCGRSLSVDRWLELRRAQREHRAPAPQWGPLWATRLVALQLSVVYLGSAYDKSHWGFLRGVRLEHLLHYLYIGSDPVHWSGVAVLLGCMATSTVVLEYALAIGLWIPKIRPYLLVTGLLFHGMLYVLLPLSTFSTSMAVLYLAYIPAERVDAVLCRLLGGAGSAQSLTDSAYGGGEPELERA